MKKLTFGCLIFSLVTLCFGQSQGALCVRHIETPIYPPIARAAHVSGKITLTVTINADGTVKHVEATADNPAAQRAPILQQSAVENMKYWTFAKPPSAPYTPYTEVVVYDYEIDPAPPVAGATPITKVTFDLPDRVTIWANQLPINI